MWHKSLNPLVEGVDGMNFPTLGLPYKVNDLRAVAA
jgi:hypothetical protein